MKNIQINELLAERGQTCLSILLPMHRLSPERRTDIIETKKAIQKAKEFIKLKYPEFKMQQLFFSGLDELTEKIDFTHNDRGLGLFISPRIKKLVKFPFPVRKKIILTNSFEIRDLLYSHYYTGPYYLLHLSEKIIRFYSGRTNALEEIKDDFFPYQVIDNYEYAHPSRAQASSGHAALQSIEKDKSIIEKSRRQEVFHHADRQIKKILPTEVPLILCGTKNELGLYKKISTVLNHLAGTITGNYTHTSLSLLGDKAWFKVKNYLEKNKLDVIHNFRERIGRGLAAEGVEAVWKAAKAGQGMTLLMEKDFAKPAFVDLNDYNIHLKPPAHHFNIISDVVDDIAETVLDKKGEVLVFENGALEDYGHIGLITRY